MGFDLESIGRNKPFSPLGWFYHSSWEGSRAVKAQEEAAHPDRLLTGLPSFTQQPRNDRLEQERDTGPGSDRCGVGEGAKKDSR